jgi:hypothetical protein
MRPPAGLGRLLLRKIDERLFRQGVECEKDNATTIGGDRHLYLFRPSTGHQTSGDLRSRYAGCSRRFRGPTLLELKIAIF